VVRRQGGRAGAGGAGHTSMSQVPQADEVSDQQEGASCESLNTEARELVVTRAVGLLDKALRMMQEAVRLLGSVQCPSPGPALGSGGTLFGAPHSGSPGPPAKRRRQDVFGASDKEIMGAVRAATEMAEPRDLLEVSTWDRVMVSLGTTWNCYRGQCIRRWKPIVESWRALNDADRAKYCEQADRAFIVRQAALAVPGRAAFRSRLAVPRDTRRVDSSGATSGSSGSAPAPNRSPARQLGQMMRPK
jgi:hypothetical protein